MSTEQKTERTRRTREFFGGVRCAPYLNPPLEPDAVTGSEATISARAYGTTLFQAQSRRPGMAGDDCRQAGPKGAEQDSGAQQGCGGFPKGEGNSINVFQLFEDGGLPCFLRMTANP
jgi:hypothetical protein